MRRNSFSIGSFGTDDEDGYTERLGGGISKRTSSASSLSGDEGLWSPRTPVPLKGLEEGVVKRLVKVEFVYAEAGKREVCLCGSWNDWKPNLMHKEADDVWSIVVTVPNGYQEFCYLADGAYAVSVRHPVTADGACNWRTIHGPPPKKKKPLGRRIASAAKSVLHAVNPAQWWRKTQITKLFDEKSDEESLGQRTLELRTLDLRTQARKVLGPLRYFGLAMLVYLAVYCVLLRAAQKRPVPG